MADHDQRFKELLRQRLADHADAGLALLHVEVEYAESVTGLRPRMYDYYHLLRPRYDLPVLPVALLLRVGLDGIGWDVYEERFWDQSILRFRYAYVGLPALDAQTFLAGENWLGVALAALMRMPEDQKARFKAEALRKLIASGENDWRRFLLCEIVQAYLPLQGPQLQDFENLLITEDYKAMLPTMKTWFEQGMEQGLEKGLEKGDRRGQLKLMRLFIEKKFGPMPPKAVQRLEAYSVDELEELAMAVLRASSLEELKLPD